MPDRGKLVVAAIMLVALGLAVFAWYWRWQQGHRAAEFWGADASRLIRGAQQSEVLRLRPITAAEAGDAAETLAIGGDEYEIIASGDLARSPGLIHARHSLTEDASFVWEPASQDECLAGWTHAMRLTEGEEMAVIAFDFRCRRVCLAGEQRTLEVLPRIAEGFQRVFARANAADTK